MIDNGPMRFALVLSLILPPVLLLASCYDPPPIPRDRPLTCAAADAGAEASRCPEGFQCIAGRICAPEQCVTNEQCPLGLVCSREFECDLPGGSGDAGTGSDAVDGSPDGPVTNPDVGSGTADGPDGGTGDGVLTLPLDGPAGQG